MCCCHTDPTSVLARLVVEDQRVDEAELYELSRSSALAPNHLPQDSVA